MDEAALSAAAQHADTEIKRAGLWKFLGDVVKGDRKTFVLSTSNAKGNVIVGNPRLQDRMKAAELLLQYRYGRPAQADPTLATKPEARKDRSLNKGEIVDEVISMMERAARLAKLKEDVKQLPVAEAEVIPE